MESATEKQDPAENHCDAVCGLDDFTEAGEKEALCSIQGLRVTREFGLCMPLLSLTYIIPTSPDPYARHGR